MLLTQPPCGPRPVDRFTAIIQGLCRAVADHGGKHRDIAPLIAFLWNRLSRTIARFERIAAHPGPPALAKPPASRAEPSADPAPDPTSDAAVAAAAEAAPPRARPKRPAPPFRLSRKFGWLGQMGHEVRAYGSQLQALLADPEMATLLAADPRMARLLRPLCRMLGVADLPDTLKPALRRRAPRAPRPPRDPDQCRASRLSRSGRPLRPMTRWSLTGRYPRMVTYYS